MNVKLLKNKFDLLEKSPLDPFLVKQIAVEFGSIVNNPRDIRAFRVFAARTLDILRSGDIKYFDACDARGALTAMLDIASVAEGEATISLEREADQIYDVLLLLDANPMERQSFIAYHCDNPLEWRFGGCLGSGGKFYARAFRVSCYQEDQTPERLLKMVSANAILKKIQSKSVTDVELRFAHLAYRWRQDRPRFFKNQQTAWFDHPSYQLIIRMGEPIVSLLIAEIENNPDSNDWHYALQQITGLVLMTKTSLYVETSEAWINWYKGQKTKANSDRLR